MTAFEAETVVNFNEEDSQAEVYTASSRVHKLLSLRGLEPYKVDTTGGKPCGWFYYLPKTAVLLKPASKAIRIGGSRKLSAVPSSAAPSAARGEV